MPEAYKKMLANSALSLEELKKFIVRQYYGGKNKDEIGKMLGVSGSSVYRFCKDYEIKLRTKTEAIRIVHSMTRGRKWTSEEAKKNVSDGVKKSYEKNEQLRKSRVDSNKKRWSKWSNEERYMATEAGLVAMHRVRHNGRKRNGKPSRT